MAKKRKPKIAAIDLFCGAGGLTHGLILEGIKVRAGVDSDSACKHPYEYNNKRSDFKAEFIEDDITTIDSAELAKYYKKGEVRVLAGCAPCQPFSTFRNAYKKNRASDSEESDDKWGLLRSFMRLINELDPDIVTMENVPQLCRHEIYKEFKQFLHDKKYEVTEKVVDCSKYGIPQRRKRLVLLASKKGEINLPPYDLYQNLDNTVESAIKNLTPVKAGKTDPNDRLHKARSLSDINLKRIKASKPGGTWKDWDENLLPQCYKIKTGESFKSVYGRMKWKEPSPVITTQFHNYGTGRFGHPKQHRALTLREAAILQTFPPDYSFVKDDDPVSLTGVGRMIGNAVPPNLGRIIAKVIREHVYENFLTT